MARRTPFLYALVAVVLGFEAVVFGLAQFPDVGERFRAVYIERNSQCWELDNSGLYRLGELVTMTNTGRGAQLLMLKRCGWLDTEASGTWSNGIESRLRFRIDPPTTDLVLTLGILPFITDAHPSQRVDVVANHVILERWTLDKSSAPEQRVTIPSDIATAPDGFLEISLRFPDARSPADEGINHDKRRLGIRLLTVKLEAANGSSAAPISSGTAL